MGCFHSLVRSIVPIFILLYSHSYYLKERIRLTLASRTDRNFYAVNLSWSVVWIIA